MSIFLIGAGFNVGAGSHQTPDRIELAYPLMGDVARLCFNLEPDQIPAGKSIEDLFADAAASIDYGPLKKLSDRLMECDWHLACPSAPREESRIYHAFFAAFSDSHFLTFNYDALPECFLYRKERWFPNDGYGLPVSVELQAHVASKFTDKKSANMVFHLHGSLYLYTVEFEIQRRPGELLGWLSQRDRPLYGFDPDAIASCFPPYRRKMDGTGYVPVEERVIAPVPNKAEELKQPFIRETYNKARVLVRESGTLIALGYSFNVHDRASYSPILDALSDSHERKLIVISPNASAVVGRIREEYPRLLVGLVNKTFSEWASDSFRCT